MSRRAKQALITCGICQQIRPKEGRGLCQQCYQRIRRAGQLDNYARQLHQSLDEWLREIDRTDPGACWPWPGSRNEDGYGIAWFEGRMRGAHRAIYKHLVGPIPSGMTIDHTCHDSNVCQLGVLCPHRACINPAHLTLATHVDNARRSLAGRERCQRGHPQTGENVERRDGRTWCKLCRRVANRNWEREKRIAAGARVHPEPNKCINGHEMTPANTYMHPQTGYRECYACRREAYRRYYERNRGKVLARRAVRKAAGHA